MVPLRAPGETNEIEFFMKKTEIICLGKHGAKDICLIFSLQNE